MHRLRIVRKGKNKLLINGRQKEIIVVWNNHYKGIREELTLRKYYNLPFIGLGIT